MDNPPIPSYITTYPPMSGLICHARQKGTKMDNLPSMHHIDTYLAKKPGWVEISNPNKNLVISDIRSRMRVVQDMWTSWENFVENYASWVNANEGSKFRDQAEMWESWARQLRLLYFGS